MAGNVADWCANEQPGRLHGRAARGSRAYVFGRYGALPNFYASDKHGFRCVVTLAGAWAAIRARCSSARRTTCPYEPRTGAEFAAILRFYATTRRRSTRRSSRRARPTVAARENRFNGGATSAPSPPLSAENFARPLHVVHFVPPDGVYFGYPSRATSRTFFAHHQGGRAVFVVALSGYGERRPRLTTAPDQKSCGSASDGARHGGHAPRLDYWRRATTSTPRASPTAASAAAVARDSHRGNETRYRSVLSWGAACTSTSWETYTRPTRQLHPAHPRAQADGQRALRREPQLQDEVEPSSNYCRSPTPHTLRGRPRRAARSGRPHHQQLAGRDSRTGQALESVWRFLAPRSGMSMPAAAP